jgi:hypothetical protein
MTPALPGSPGDFTNIVRAMLLSTTRAEAIAIAEEWRYDRALRVLKSTVIAGSLADPDYAGALVDYSSAVTGFVDSLRTTAAFDAMLSSMVRVPMRTRAAFTVLGATGAVVGETQYKPVSRLTLGATDLVPRKATCIFVLTQELARALAAPGDAFLVRELRGAVGGATDVLFVSELAIGAAEVASSGSTAQAVYRDIASLLALVPIGQASRLFLIMAPAVAAQIAVKPTSDGAPAFPEMTPAGGQISGITVLTSDALASDSAGSRVLLADASGVAADSQTITLDRSTVATLELDDSAAGGASVVLTSLFQSNLTAVKAERLFAFQRLRDNAVAELVDVNYGDLS